MNIAITFRHMDSSDAVKTYASDKVAKIQKFLRQPMKGQVTLSCQHRMHSAELVVHSGHEHFHATEESEDMYASIDKVIDKIEAQIRHSKAHGQKKGGERASQRLLPDVGEE
jgi:putative sigma-54 modulation protein